MEHIMKECKYCRTKYEDNLNSCPNCGGTKVITEQEKAEDAALYQKEIENRESAVAVVATKRKLLISALVGIVVVIIAVVALVSYNANKPLSNGMTKDEGEAILAEGIAFYNNGDYESAIECFVQLPSDSKQYDEAQSMLAKCEDEYSASVVEKANGYAENGEYEMAINLLNNAGDLLPNSAAISTAYDKIFTEYKGIVCSNAYSAAETFAANGDYPSAITAIDNATKLIGHDDELAAKRGVYVDTYVSQTVSAAKAQYIEYNYESIIAAEGILEVALKILPDNEVLLTELANYKEREPVSLLDLEVDHSNSLRAYFRGYEYAGEKKDTLGNSYSTTIVPSDWLEESHPYGWSPTYSLAGCEWKLDYQYSKITGTVCFDGVYANSPIEIELTIMNSSRMDSGSEKVFTLSSSTGSKNFDVDLTGAKTLYLGLEQSDIGGTYSFLANVYVWK